MRPGRVAVSIALGVVLLGCGTQASAAPAGTTTAARMERVAADGWAMDLPVGRDERRPPQDGGGQWTSGDPLDPDWIISLQVAPLREATVEEMVGGLMRSRGEVITNGRLDAGARPLRHLVFGEGDDQRDFLVFEGGDRVAVLDGVGVPLEVLVQMATTFQDTTP